MGLRFEAISPGPIPLRLPAASSFQGSTGFGCHSFPVAKLQNVWWSYIDMLYPNRWFILSTLAFFKFDIHTSEWNQLYSKNLWWLFKFWVSYGSSPQKNDQPVYACLSNTSNPWRALVPHRLIDSNLKHHGAWWTHLSGESAEIPKHSSARAGRSSTVQALEVTLSYFIVLSLLSSIFFNGHIWSFPDISWVIWRSCPTWAMVAGEFFIYIYMFLFIYF